MSRTPYFPDDYQSSREAFRSAALAAGARLAAYVSPAEGPKGETLHTDVAVLGDDSAPHVLLCNSATHGVEGFCGSGVFRGWLESGESERLPRTIKVVLVHALNCYGFAWLRRVTEDNVDLNRNFVNHGISRPHNPEYSRLHDDLLPDRWDAGAVASLEKKFQNYINKHSQSQLQAVLTGGQYDHPDGIFYGGDRPTAARERFLKIVDEHVSGAAHVLFLDWHTGLGPYGSAELIGATRPGTMHGDRVRSWFVNGLTSPADGNSSSAPLSGTIGSGLRRHLQGHGTDITSLTVEFGTYPPFDVLVALIADNWLHLSGEIHSDTGRSIKRQIRKALYPDEDDWKELVWIRGRQLLRRAVKGLSSL